MKLKKTNHPGRNKHLSRRDPIVRPTLNQFRSNSKAFLIDFAGGESDVKIIHSIPPRWYNAYNATWTSVRTFTRLSGEKIAIFIAIILQFLKKMSRILRLAGKNFIVLDNSLWAERR